MRSLFVCDVYKLKRTTVLIPCQQLSAEACLYFRLYSAYAKLGREPVLHEHTEPYELEYRDGHWYYTAYVLALNTFLDYRVDRMRPGSLRKEHDRFSPAIRQRPEVKFAIGCHRCWRGMVV